MSNRIAEIRARVEAATAGPWVDLLPNDACSGSAYMIRSALHTREEGVVQQCRYDGTPWCLPEDRTFIAAAREDVPWLLDQIATLTARLRATRNELAERCADLALALRDRDALRQRCVAVAGARAHDIGATWLAAQLTVALVSTDVQSFPDGPFRSGWEMACEEIQVRLKMESRGEPSCTRASGERFSALEQARLTRPATPTAMPGTETEGR